MFLNGSSGSLSMIHIVSHGINIILCVEQHEEPREATYTMWSVTQILDITSLRGVNIDSDRNLVRTWIRQLLDNSQVLCIWGEGHLVFFMTSRSNVLKLFYFRNISG